MAAVWYRFRAEMRTRWIATLGLAVIVGLAGGVVFTAVDEPGRRRARMARRPHPAGPALRSE